jgi:hypothetical protein
MEDFKSNTKMQCFKEGGSVKYESRKQHKEEMKSDIAQDKAVVKKAFSMHDKQEHKGEKTNLSKLNKGGRAKKACGTVKKYACGGGVYGAKKTKEDIKSIEAAKNCKPKKMQYGGSSGMTGASTTGPEANAMSAAAQSGGMDPVAEKIKMMEKKRQMDKMKRAMALDPAQQGELISQDPRAAGLSAMPMGRKNGGKAKKSC